MNTDTQVFIENLLRRIFQPIKEIKDDLITSSDIKELLEKHNFFVEVSDINDMMFDIGFRGNPIPHEADKIWMVKQCELE
jgi:hypothetical protein